MVCVCSFVFFVLSYFFVAVTLQVICYSGDQQTPPPPGSVWLASCFCLARELMVVLRILKVNLNKSKLLGFG